MKPKRMATKKELEALRAFVWNPPEPDCDLGSDNTYDDEDEDEQIIEDEGQN